METQLLHVCILLQLNEELTQILNGDWSMNGNGVSVTSAPVILYINSPRCSVSREELAVIDDRLLKRVSLDPDYKTIYKTLLVKQTNRQLCLPARKSSNKSTALYKVALIVQ